MKVPLVARLATAVLVLGVVGGCSGNSDPEPDTDPTESSTSESDPTESPTSEGEPTEGSEEVDAFCASFIELGKEGDESIPVEQVGDEIDSLVENAPEALAPDVDVISSSYQALVEAIETAGYDIGVLTDDTQLTAEEQAQIQTEAEANGYDREASDAAAENIEVWAGENCEGYVPEEEPSAEGSAGDVEAVCGAYEQLNAGITAEESLKQFKILVDNAPPEISADTVTLQAGVVAYIDAVEAAGFDMSVLDDQSKLNKKEQAAYNDALEAANVDFEAAQAAATNLNNWATANC